jgi:hypothetical protein
MITYRTLQFVTALACLPASLSAATLVSDTFDTGLEGWGSNTTQTNVSHVPAGGNPGGYVDTENTSSSSQSFGTIGAVNSGPDYSGVFADGVWNVKVDLRFVSGGFTGGLLRFRYKDSTANGWYLPLESSNFTSNWQNYSINFDTTWDDATAIANGWVKEPDGTLTATPSFAGLWDDVYTSEIRLVGNGGLRAGIDNYQAAPVPVPAAVWLLGSALMGLLTVRRRC